MMQPDVVITDYLLSIEASLLTFFLWRSGSAGSDLRMPFVVFFAAIALAALAGGTVHAISSGSASSLGTVLWRGSLLALGVAALAAWVIGARLALPVPAARVVQIVAATAAAGYAVIVVAVNDSFWIAIAHYAPPTLFLFFAFAADYRRARDGSDLVGLIGLVLTLVAAIVQQRRIALDPVYFDHNALYHAIQAVALFLIYRAGLGLV